MTAMGCSSPPVVGETARKGLSRLCSAVPGYCFEENLHCPIVRRRTTNLSRHRQKTQRLLVASPPSKHPAQSRCQRSELERPRHRRCVFLHPPMRRKSSETTCYRRIRHRTARQKTRSPCITQTPRRQTRSQSRSPDTMYPRMITRKKFSQHACNHTKSMLQCKQ